MQSYTLGDLAEDISILPLEKDCELNRDTSLNFTNREHNPNLTDLVQKLNKNVSDEEEVDSATQTALVAVYGYKVKGEIAPFLRKILSEHGDIANECILQTPETRAALLESVCMIYRELESKFPNIMSLEVNSMQARIKDLETVRLRVEWLYKRLERVSNVKLILDQSRYLEEARAKYTESIDREDRDLEALEAEISTLQQKISSKKADLALLKTEAEIIEDAFETMARTEALPEKSTVSVTRKTGGKKWNIPNSEVLNQNDVQQPQLSVRARSKRGRPLNVNPWFQKTPIACSDVKKSSNIIELKGPRTFELPEGLKGPLQPATKRLPEYPNHTEMEVTFTEHSVGTKFCTHCHVKETPQWREGPLGKNTLCNACGVRYRSGRLFPEYRPATSPTFELPEGLKGPLQPATKRLPENINHTEMEVTFTQPSVGTKFCTHCHVKETPQWREGPLGKNTLCNACGVRYRSGRLFPEYRPAASPTFSPSLHSNSHKKVIVMRKKAKQEPALEDNRMSSVAAFVQV